MPKACEPMILEPTIDSVAALKIAQKDENLKLVDEKDSLFASNVTGSWWQFEL